MNISKLKYGLNRLLNELISKEDYWHVNMPLRKKNKFDLNTYHLDITKKAEYPFKINDNIPIVNINGKETELVITIVSYGLGLIDVGFEKNIEKLISITKWLVENQDADGSGKQITKIKHINLNQDGIPEWFREWLFRSSLEL